MSEWFSLKSLLSNDGLLRLKLRGVGAMAHKSNPYKKARNIRHHPPICQYRVDLRHLAVHHCDFGHSFPLLLANCRQGPSFAGSGRRAFPAINHSCWMLLYLYTCLLVVKWCSEISEMSCRTTCPRFHRLRKRTRRLQKKRRRMRQRSK